MRLAIRVLDNRSWLELYAEANGDLRAEFHRPHRVSSNGWVDKPAVAVSPDAEAAIAHVLAGTDHAGKAYDLARAA